MPEKLKLRPESLGLNDGHDLEPASDVGHGSFYGGETPAGETERRRATDILESLDALRPLTDLDPGNGSGWLMDTDPVYRFDSDGPEPTIDPMKAEIIGAAIPEATKAVPFDFEDRNDASRLTEALSRYPEFQAGEYIPALEKPLIKIARSMAVSPASLERLVSAHNARKYFTENPVRGSLENANVQQRPLRIAG